MRGAGGDRGCDIVEHRDDFGKAADRENLADDTVEGGDDNAALLWLQLGSRHQRAQPGARDVFDRSEVDDDIGGAGAHRDQQPVLKRRAGQVVDAADRPQHQHPVLTRFAYFHRRLHLREARAVFA